MNNLGLLFSLSFGLPPRESHSHSIELVSYFFFFSFSFHSFLYITKKLPFNPLHPKIRLSVHILHNALYTFSKVLTRRTNLLNNQELRQLLYIMNGNVHYVNEEYNSADLSRSTNFLFCRIIIWLNHLSIKAKVTFFQLRPVLKCFCWLAISLNRCSCDRGNEQTQTIPVRSLKE